MLLCDYVSESLHANKNEIDVLLFQDDTSGLTYTVECLSFGPIEENIMYFSL